MNKVKIAAVLLLAGCANYRWTSGVPENMRTVNVPVMRNESTSVELGSAMAQQVAREFQREGTFKLATGENAALEVQGVVKSIRSTGNGYSRRSGLRVIGFTCTAQVEVSVVDKVNGRVLIDNRLYTAHTTFATGQDTLSAQRGAAGRLADDLARQVVDDVLNLKW